MQAIVIVAMIFALLSQAAVMAIFILKLTRKFDYRDVMVVAPLGLLILSDIFWMIFTRGTIITAAIFTLIAWPVLAAAFVLKNLDMVSSLGQKLSEMDQAAAAAEQSSAQAAEGAAAPPASEETSGDGADQQRP